MTGKNEKGECKRGLGQIDQSLFSLRRFIISNDVF